jgi:hypothetical protein
LINIKIDLIQEKNLSNNLKSIYNIIKKDEEIKPRIENNIFQNDKNWLHIYKKVLYKKIPSNTRYLITKYYLILYQQLKSLIKVKNVTFAIKKIAIFLII